MPESDLKLYSTNQRESQKYTYWLGNSDWRVDIGKHWYWQPVNLLKSIFAYVFIRKILTYENQFMNGLSAKTVFIFVCNPQTRFYIDPFICVLRVYCGLWIIHLIYF